MRARPPHYLLFSQAADRAAGRDRWRFVLQSAGSSERLSAADAEPGVPQSRLELLAVVRGLEALDQPSRVTLLTGSRYVSQGIRRSLSQWRARRWRWERFGKLVPIRDHDLWRRVDRALEIHEVECRPWHWEAVEPTGASPSQSAAAHSTADGRECEPAVLIVNRSRRHRREPTHRSGIGRRLTHLKQWISTLGTAVWRPAFTRAA